MLATGVALLLGVRQATRSAITMAADRNRAIGPGLPFNPLLPVLDFFEQSSRN
jgi:hypothetical protein